MEKSHPNGELYYKIFQEQKEIIGIIEKMKSSIKNKYCLYCKLQIVEDDNHNCKSLEIIGNKIVDFYLLFATKDFKKEILENLNDPIIKNKEFAEMVRNKILAFSM